MAAGFTADALDALLVVVDVVVLLDFELPPQAASPPPIISATSDTKILLRAWIMMFAGSLAGCARERHLSDILVPRENVLATRAGAG
ncbi:MAG: hypothetical protein JO372_25875 [Solirubrobacterales bacterium]|nr:hypothetical protein [Solirubrobacterales bacterium]